MELELELDPDAVADVIGLRLLAALREGRARTHAVKLVWHDSPDHALQHQGLTVAEQRDGWRLEQVTPSAGTWLPGQPAPIVEAAKELASLTASLPFSLAPVAAFEGRRTVSVHRLAATAPSRAASAAALPARAAKARPAKISAPRAAKSRMVVASASAIVASELPAEPDAAIPTRVTLAIERGVLRSVAAERPVARITLSGEDRAVHTVALMIAAAVPVRVPCASLAAQAFALATGEQTPARHLGAPVLPDAGLSVPDALAHILGHLTDVVLHYAPAAARPQTKAQPRKGLGNHGVGHDGGAGHGSGAGHGGAQGAAAAAADPESAEPEGAGPEGGRLGEMASAALDAGRIEAVHQMRVAVRRALSAVSICRDALPDGTLDTVRDELKALGARLGQTRDWDVFVSETAPMITQSLATDERLDRLVAAAVRRQRACRTSLADYLTSSAFRLLGIELAWFVAARCWHADRFRVDASHGGQPAAASAGDAPTPEDASRSAPDHQPERRLADMSPAPQTVRNFAPGILQHRWKKLLSAAKRIEELDIPSLHGVRLRAKRARYAAEMFALPHEGKAAHRFIRRLSLLQQRLGVLNDGAVAAQLLGELGGPAGRHAYAVGVVVGFTAARAAKIRPRIIRAFEKFRRQATYWT